jgi:type I site-specific restriction endonuclease
MPKFFVLPEKVQNNKILIDTDDVSHITRVLRLGIDDVLTICDSMGRDFEAKISEISDKKIITIAFYEAYLNDLFVLAVSTHGTPEKSVDEILLETAILYGRAVEEAKEDVKRILNVRSAVGVLLKGASEKFTPP